MPSTRTYTTAILAVLAAMLLSQGSSLSADRDSAVTFTSSSDAYKQGRSAIRSRNFELAIPAFEFSARKGWLPAKYFLARIYADNSGPYTDHNRAYKLFLEVASEAPHVDSGDYRMVPTVSGALVAVGRYVRNGLPAIGVKADPVRAAQYFEYAASNFNDANAQFEIAKMKLVGDGVPVDRNNALHWLSRLATAKAHAGAQAFLAELYWRGKFVPRDPQLALGLIEVARANAPSQDQIWIDEAHHFIFCGASSMTREQSTGFVANWEKRYGRPSNADADKTDDGLGPLARAERVCSNGDRVVPIGRPDLITQAAPTTGSTDVDADNSPGAVEKRSRDAIDAANAAAGPTRGSGGFMRPPSGGFGLGLSSPGGGVIRIKP